METEVNGSQGTPPAHGRRPRHGPLSTALMGHETSQLQNPSCAPIRPNLSEVMSPGGLGGLTTSSRDFASTGPTIHDDQSIHRPRLTPSSSINSGAITNASAASTVSAGSRHSLPFIHTGSADDLHGCSRPPDISQRSTGLEETAPISPDADSLPPHHGTPSPGPESSTPATSWKSVYLDWKFLLYFSALFGSTLIAIEIVARISSQRHGLATGQPQLHYLWKYGTTAVFTLFVTF
ncbi:hypothetical protein NUW58_g4656 [Xylaria curta]|uniref:Uncharacterized protein n=1 Tax=Xylaria curta TaxID=42375 RepID=A0ACC1P856_9PEZI|nr:hypothetical protein NUW58_g4656 [Xylaria curta]